VRYRFIEQERRSYPVGRLCGVMQVSRSGFYAWRRRPKSNRARQDELLTRQIQRIHQQNRGIYGAPRIHAELRDQQVRASRKRVARLMRLAGLQGKRKGVLNLKRTPSPTSPASNLLALGTSASGPDQIWVSDITYLRTAEGWLYLAVVLDVYSRRVVGWAMRERLTAALTVDAFKMAYRQRRPPPGLIHHSDRGTQYTSGTFRAAPAAVGALPSMGRSALDNALAVQRSTEPKALCFFATLKCEEARSYPSCDVARRYLFDYLETFYNRRRRHSSLGFLSPVAFEELAAKRRFTDCLR
jgi:putative transposase